MLKLVTLILVAVLPAKGNGEPPIIVAFGPRPPEPELKTKASSDELFFNRWDHISSALGGNAPIRPAATSIAEAPASSGGLRFFEPNQLSYRASNWPEGIPYWLCFAGGKLYVSCTNKGGHIIRVLNAHTRRLEKELPMPGYVSSLVASDDGRTVLATILGWRKTLELIHVADGARESVRCDEPGLAAAMHNGRIYLAEYGGELQILARERSIARIPVGARPTDVLVTPDASAVLVLCSDSDCVSVIDPHCLKETSRIPVGRTPMRMALSADARTVYVTNQNDNSVTVIDLRLLKVKAVWPVDKAPIAIAVGRDNRVFVGCKEAGTVLELNGDSGQILHRYELEKGMCPWGIAITP